MLESLSAWSDEMLRLDTETLTKVLKLGARIQKLIRGEGTPVADGSQSKVNALGAMTGP